MENLRKNRAELAADYLAAFDVVDVYGNIEEKFSLSDLFGYLYESYINGNKKQAKEILTDVIDLWNDEDIYSAVFECSITIGIVAFMSVMAKTGANRTICLNALYDNDWINYDKNSHVVNAIFDELQSVDE